MEGSLGRHATRVRDELRSAFRSETSGSRVPVAGPVSVSGSPLADMGSAMPSPYFASSPLPFRRPDVVDSPEDLFHEQDMPARKRKSHFNPTGAPPTKLLAWLPDSPQAHGSNTGEGASQPDWTSGQEDPEATVAATLADFLRFAQESAPHLLVESGEDTTPTPCSLFDERGWTATRPGGLTPFRESPWVAAALLKVMQAFRHSTVPVPEPSGTVPSFPGAMNRDKFPQFPLHPLGQLTRYVDTPSFGATATPVSPDDQSLLQSKAAEQKLHFLPFLEGFAQSALRSASLMDSLLTLFKHMMFTDDGDFRENLTSGDGLAVLQGLNSCVKHNVSMWAHVLTDVTVARRDRILAASDTPQAAIPSLRAIPLQKDSLFGPYPRILMREKSDQTQRKAFEALARGSSYKPQQAAAPQSSRHPRRSFQRGRGRTRGAHRGSSYRGRGGKAGAASEQPKPTPPQ